MYKHEDTEIEDDDFIEKETRLNDSDENYEDNIDDADINDMDEETYDADDDKKNRTFQNPSQSGRKDNSTVFAEMLKCGMCDFRCMTKCDIRDHKERTHNWCYICYSSFDNQTKLKNHNNATHSENN